jgi:uncharacterized membrane protein YdjX (TVP38/TMEM64 family)
LVQQTPRWRLLWHRRVVLSVLALALLFGAWQLGAFESFGSPDKVRALIDSWGVWAYVLYVVTFVVLMPFGIPAFVWVLPAGILWPFWIAYSLSLLAVAGASSVGFLFARYIAHDWVSTRMPSRIRRLDERFAASGLRFVILFRLVFMLGAPTHWLLGLSRIGYGTFVVGTVIGAMPVVALVAWFGHDVIHWAEVHGAMAAAILAAAIAGGLIGRRWLRARRARRA